MVMQVKSTLRFSADLLKKIENNPDEQLIWSGDRVQVPVFEDISCHPLQNQDDHQLQRIVAAANVLGLKLMVWHGPSMTHVGLKVCFTKDVEQYINPMSISVSMELVRAAKDPVQEKNFQLKTDPGLGRTCWMEDTLIGPTRGWRFNSLSQMCSFDTFMVSVDFAPKKSQILVCQPSDPMLEDCQELREEYLKVEKYEAIDPEEYDHLADVQIITDGSVIPCHSLLLSMRSRVLAAMFKHGMKESSQKTLTIEDFNHGTVLKMVNYLYGQHLQDEDFDVDLLRIADKYDILRLKIDCQMHLSKMISEENVAELWHESHQSQAPFLKLKALSFIRENWRNRARMSSLKDVLKKYPDLIEDIMPFLELR